jgi:hypothetical protein
MARFDFVVIPRKTRKNNMVLGQAKWLPALLVSLLLSACGGGSDSSSSSRSRSIASLEANAPQATGDSATDTINWFNFRRQQIGLPGLARNGKIDTAALGHSIYQTYNGITHIQTEGNQGFTGACLYDNVNLPDDPNTNPCARSKDSRLEVAHYQFAPATSYAYGEVIVRTGDPSGFEGAEDLIAAIYHRFVIFEPVFKEVGSGVATAPDGAIYMTTDFAVSGIVGQGGTVIYPFANQQNVATNFYSDTESPDPVPGKNEVGYPISIHADITSIIAVQSFTVQPRGGSSLPVRLLTKATDPSHTRESVAAIVPLDVLAGATTYDVQFSGTVDGLSVNRSWSFTTR